MTQSLTGRTRSMRVPLPISRSGFGLGTSILTTDGAIPVEFLEPGDRVITQDRGAVRLARTIARSVPAADLVRVRPAALSPDTPARDLVLSARQKIVLTGWRAQAMFARPAVLVEIGRLVDGDYISRLTGDRPMQLIQLAFDDARHVIALAGGTLLAATPALPAPSRA